MPQCWTASRTKLRFCAAIRRCSGTSMKNAKARHLCTWAYTKSAIGWVLKAGSSLPPLAAWHRRFEWELV